MTQKIKTIRDNDKISKKTYVIIGIISALILVLCLVSCTMIGKEARANKEPVKTYILPKDIDDDQVEITYLEDSERYVVFLYGRSYFIPLKEVKIVYVHVGNVSEIHILQYSDKCELYFYVNNNYIERFSL